MQTTKLKCFVKQPTANSHRHIVINESDLILFYNSVTVIVNSHSHIMINESDLILFYNSVTVTAITHSHIMINESDLILFHDSVTVTANSHNHIIINETDLSLFHNSVTVTANPCCTPSLTFHQLGTNNSTYQHTHNLCQGIRDSPCFNLHWNAES